MTTWWITLLMAYCTAALSRYFAIPCMVEQKKIYKPNKLFMVICTSILILVAGLRLDVGDTQVYRRFFKSYPNNFFEFIRTVDFSQDGGYTLMVGIIKCFITDSSQVYIFIISLITLTLIIVVLYKYAGTIELAIYIFITLGNYLVTMNGMRQYLASAILFAAFPYIYEKDWKKYILIVLIASSIHASALIFIPVYFFVNAKAWGKISKWLLVGGILTYIAYPITGRILNTLLINTKYSNYGEGILTGSAGGSNIIRTLVYAVPVILAYIGREKIGKNEKYFNIVLNMSILNLIFMLLSNPASWIFARYCIYFSLYMIILICWCIEYSFNQKDKPLIYVLCMILFGLYYFYEMHISLKLPYTSYLEIF